MLLWYVFVGISLASAVTEEHVTVKVNLSSKTPFPHFWSSGVGSGHAALTTRQDWRDHMRLAHDELGFEYVRYHGVLDDTSLYLDAPSNKKRASYYDVLSTYQFLISIGVRPVVELSFTPSPVNNGTCNHFYYKGCETAPDNFALYGEYVSNFTTAMVNHFGVEEVAKWYFEVYNEADLHWPFEQYFELYKAAAVAVHSVSPRLRVGGPASAFPTWVGKLVEQCKNQSVPLDFVSSHAYPTTGRARNAEMVGLMRQIDAAHQAASGLPHLVTEWNGVCNSRGTWHDETAQPSFIVAAVDAVSTVSPTLDMFAYWAVSDVFTEMGLPSESVAFHGGFGLISLYGIPKPGFQAFKLLNKAGTWRVNSSATPATNLTVLPLWDADTETLRVFLAASGYVGESVPNRTVTVELAGTNLPRDWMSNRTLPGRLWRIDDMNCNPKQAWIDMGSPDYLNPKQIDMLKQKAQVSANDVSWLSGDMVWSFTLQVPAFGLAVLDFTPRRDPTINRSYI